MRLGTIPVAGRALEGARDWWRFVSVAVAGTLLAVFGTYEAIVLIGVIGPQLGEDFLFYRAIGERWLETGAYYLPHQLAGPYSVTLQVDNLYPPHALALFLAFTVLPPPLWWIVPLGVTAYVVAAWRPAWWSWPLLALLILWPRTLSAVLWGNIDMWLLASVAAGLRWGWPALLLTIKPTVAVLALVGARHRSFSTGGMILALASLAMLPMWLDYLTIIRNVSIPWDYSLGTIPVLLLPIVGWWARTSAPRPLPVPGRRPVTRAVQPAAATSVGRVTRAPSS
jgi:hypothetical protein